MGIMSSSRVRVLAVFRYKHNGWAVGNARLLSPNARSISGVRYSLSPTWATKIVEQLLGLPSGASISSPSPLRVASGKLTLREHITGRQLKGCFVVRYVALVLWLCCSRGGSGTIYLRGPLVISITNAFGLVRSAL